MNRAVAEGVENDEGAWIVRKSTALIKVWTRSRGSDINPAIPCLRVEHHFPDVQDPELILMSLNKERVEWDKQLESCDELTEYTTDTCLVNRLVNTSIFGAGKREFIEKKVFFRDEEGSIYMWVTACPDEVYENKPPYVRSYSLVGVFKIGVHPTGGCYLHVISQTDIKMPTWVINSIIPLIPG